MHQFRLKSICAILAFPIAVARIDAQQTIPVVTLSEPATISQQKFGGILGVRELPRGKVLIDDGGHRQLLLLDTTLTNGMVILDSSSAGPSAYGKIPAPIVPYRGDSTLIPDYASFAMLVIDDRGRIARSLALPTPADLTVIRRGAGLDAAGRLIYLGQNGTIAPAVTGELPTRSDSMPLLRADFDLRRTDTIAYLMHPLSRIQASSPDSSFILAVWMIDQLRTLDDWSLLSDGTIAIVRGHDYHVDLIGTNDARSAAPKLPFDWKRRTDSDKLRIQDSVRNEVHEALEDGSIVNRIISLNIMRTKKAPMANTTGRPTKAANGTSFPGFNLLPADTASLHKLDDYYPPVRDGAAMADLSGNLWILPTTSAQSKLGELVYDVVNNRGTLIRRVRVPLGRIVVGFGKGEVVYMTSGDIRNGFRLERSRLPASN